jgi:hypothetical protein
MKKAALLIALCASGAASATTTWRKPDDVTGFGQWRIELQRIMDDYSKSKLGHFCIVVQYDDKNLATEKRWSIGRKEITFKDITLARTTI